MRSVRIWKPLQMPSTGRGEPPATWWALIPASAMIVFITGAKREIAPARR